MERFWSKVEKSGGPDACWLWRAGRFTGTGYGMFSVGGRIRRAHRVAFVLAHGEIPEGMCVIHSCDRPACVNPAHLRLGTHTDNMRDMAAKGRDAGPRGEAHHDAKLSTADIPAIRSDTRVQREIAADYGISQSTVSDIQLGKIWRHVAAASAVSSESEAAGPN